MIGARRAGGISAAAGGAKVARVGRQARGGWRSKLRARGAVIAVLGAGLLSGAAAATGQESLAAVPRALELHIDMRPDLPLLRVEARLRWRAARRLVAVSLRLPADLQLDAVEDGDGLPLYWQRDGNEVHVATPELVAGTEVTWRIRYRVPLSRTPRATSQVVRVAPWYPHFRYPPAEGFLPRDVPMLFHVAATLPAEWSLLGAGIREAGDGGASAMQRWVDGIPSVSYPLLILRHAEHRRAEDGGQRLEAFFPAETASTTESYVGYMFAALRFYGRLLGPHPRRTFMLAGLDLPERVGGLSTPGITVVPAPDATAESPFPYRIFAHEIAHHWWNQGAHARRRADAWLHESLPTYTALLFLEQEHGGPMFRRELERTRAVALDVASPGPLSETRRLVDPRQRYALEYHKGAFVLHMLRVRIGKPSFQQTLRRLYAGGGPLTTDGLIEAAEAVHGENLSDFFAAWVGLGAVPRLAVRYTQRRADDPVSPVELVVAIEQRDATVRHPVLLRIVLEGAPPVERTVWIEPGSTTLSIGLPSAVREMILDPHGDLLHGGITVDEDRGPLP